MASASSRSTCSSGWYVWKLPICCQFVLAVILFSFVDVSFCNKALLICPPLSACYSSSLSQKRFRPADICIKKPKQIKGSTLSSELNWIDPCCNLAITAFHTPRTSQNTSMIKRWKQTKQTVTNPINVSLTLSFKSETCLIWWSYICKHDPMQPL